jgi:ATP-dependent RNA helicase RhlE
VMALLPAQRQNLFFSATFPEEVQSLADQLLHDPVCITIEAVPQKEAVIFQRAIAVDTAQRTPLLRHLFKSQGWDRALVFVATKYTAELISEKLYKAGIYAAPFHGDLSQGARTQVLDEFKDHRWDLLITTDLAARGIDIAQMPVVINYDLPRSATDYVHRIGRTGRAGESGLAISFVTAESEAHFRLIEKRQGLALPREIEVGFEPQDVLAAPATAVGQAGADGGGIKGKRPSKKDKLRAAGLLPAAGSQKSP